MKQVCEEQEEEKEE